MFSVDTGGSSRLPFSVQVLTNRRISGPAGYGAIVTTSAANTETEVDVHNEDDRPTRVRDIVGGIVACVGLAALATVAGFAIFELPSAKKGASIVAIASPAFGVIGSIVGAYFGIRSAGKAVEQVRRA
jgi:hypothetical protein